MPNGVDLAALLGLADATVGRWSAPPDLLAFDPLVLLPARITPRKNVELALRVVAAMRADGRPAPGSWSPARSIPTIPRATDTSQRSSAFDGSWASTATAVFLAELLDEPANEALVDDLYRLADVMLLPSLDEGFGIPILEAGRPPPPDRLLGPAGAPRPRRRRGALCRPRTPIPTASPRWRWRGSTATRS